MIKRQLTLTFLFLQLSFNLFAQLDTTFWFGAPDLQGAHGDRPIFLRASTGKEAAVVTISIPANTGFIPISVSIPANSSQSIDLTSYIDLIENGDPNIPQNKGLKISSTSFISAYYDIANGLNGDIYPLKGANALGFKFTIPFQMDFPGNFPFYKATFVILAIDDDTRVTITPKNNLTGIPSGVATTIILQKGQTYTCEASSNIANQRPGGTIVEANKKIAISTKDDSINYSVGGCSDTAGDQLIPDCLAGNEFAIMKGYLFGSDHFYIFAITNGTVIKINGIQVATINAGDFYKGQFSDASLFIEASQPVHVFHITGFGCELGGAILPSLINDGSSSISLTRASNEELFINILSPSSIINAFQINGSSTLIDASQFTVVPGSSGKWMTARINLPQTIVPAGNNFQVTNSLGKFHAGMIHGGQSSTCRYGYFSDFARSNIDLIGYDTLYCQGDSVKITASGKEISNVKWRGPNGLNIDGPILTIKKFEQINEGEYFISATDSKCGFVEKKIALKIQRPAGTLFTPSRTDLCKDSIILLSATGGTSYRWLLNGTVIPGESKETLKANFPGTYSVELISQYGCKNLANGSITLLPLANPIASFTTTAPCLSTPTIFKNFSDTTYTGPITCFWNFGDGQNSNIFSPTHQYLKSGDFIITLKVFSNRCPSQKDSISKRISISENSKGERYSTINAIENENTTLTAKSGGKEYLWIPSTNIDNPLKVNPIFKGSTSIDYLIRYRTEDNCIVIDSQLVRIFSQINIQAPKGFSPNGDGHNDKLEFQLIGIKKSIYFRVFNRWGQLLFETKDPKHFWDGKFKGVNQPLETYIWTAEGISFDEKSVIKRGQTVLIR
jgi:gliding motility-associated-like protein